MIILKIMLFWFFTIKHMATLWIEPAIPPLLVRPLNACIYHPPVVEKLEKSYNRLKISMHWDIPT